jgi:type IV secretion system protein TrbD
MVANSDREGLISLVHQSLVQPQLMGGIPKRAAILNGTITACLVQGTKIWWLIGVGLVLHVLMYWMTQRDPEWMAVSMRYWKTARYFDV